MAAKKKTEEIVKEVKAAEAKVEKVVKAAAAKAKKAPAKAAATVKTAAKKTEKKIAVKAETAAKKPAAKAKATKLEIYVQSPLGGNITPEEIAAKLPEGAESVFVRVDQNKLWWIKGEESGSVDIW